MPSYWFNSRPTGDPYVTKSTSDVKKYKPGIIEECFFKQQSSNLAFFVKKKTIVLEYGNK